MPRAPSPAPPTLPCPQLMMEQSKKSSLMVARSILNNKLISKKLERYLKVRRWRLAPAPPASWSPSPGLWPRGSSLPTASLLLCRARTLSPTALRRKRNRRTPRVAPRMREHWLKRQRAWRMPRARRHSPLYPLSPLPELPPRHHRRRPPKQTRKPCPCWVGRCSARSAESRASMWKPTMKKRRAAGAPRDLAPERAGPARPGLEAELNKVIPIPPLRLSVRCGSQDAGQGWGCAPSGSGEKCACAY